MGPQRIRYDSATNTHRYFLLVWSVKSLPALKIWRSRDQIMPRELQNLLVFPSFLMAGICFLWEPLHQGCCLLWLWLVRSVLSKCSKCFAGFSPRSQLSCVCACVCVCVCVCARMHAHGCTYRPCILSEGNISPRSIKLVLQGWKIFLLCTAQIRAAYKQIAYLWY